LTILRGIPRDKGSLPRLAEKMLIRGAIAAIASVGNPAGGERRKAALRHWRKGGSGRQGGVGAPAFCDVLTKAGTFNDEAHLPL